MTGLALYLIFKVRKKQVEQEWKLNKCKIMMVINLLIIAPITEEIALRGIVYTRIEKTTNAITSIIVSSVLFGLMHFSAGGLVLVIGAMLMAFVFCYIFKFNSLWVCIIAHAAANLPDFILYNKPNLSGWVFI